MLRHVVLTAKTTHARPKVFSFNYSIIWQFCCTLYATFHTSQNSFKFGRQKLVMMNYAWDFSQSEMNNNFIIIALTDNLCLFIGHRCDVM